MNASPQPSPEIVPEPELTYPLYKGPATHAPDISDRRVLFHGVNKSGSLAMSTILRKLYQLHDREDEFMCRYMGIPNTLPAALESFELSEGKPRILIDHGLVGHWQRFPDAPYITQLRNPVRRIISCYFWQVSHHPDNVKGRDLLQWCRDGAMYYTHIFQFACNAGPDPEVRIPIRALSQPEVRQRAEEWFASRVEWFGITDLFEASIHSLARSLGFDRAPLWVPDRRNSARPRWETVDEDVLKEIEEIIFEDVDFYNAKRRLFEARNKELLASPELAAYKVAAEDVRTQQESYGASA